MQQKSETWNQARLIAVNLQGKMQELKNIQCDSLDHTAASTPRLSFLWFGLFLMILLLNFVWRGVGCYKLQGQKAEARVRGDVWDWHEFHKESIKSQKQKKEGMQCEI